MFPPKKNKENLKYLKELQYFRKNQSLKAYESFVITGEKLRKKG